MLRPSPEDTAASRTSDNFAPGANDDGSGTALTMELARVLSQSDLRFDATLVFIALAGEEEGLLGAAAHAQKAAEEGIRIDAVLNNDIIGNSHGGNGALDGSSIRVFSEGPEGSPSRQLARYVRRAGSIYLPGHQVRLIAREDRFGRGGDHTAFNRNGDVTEFVLPDVSIDDCVFGVAAVDARGVESLVAAYERPPRGARGSRRSAATAAGIDP